MIQFSTTLTKENQTTLWRALQAFNATRIVIALILLAYLSLHERSNFWMVSDFLYREVCVLYLVLALSFALLASYYRQNYLFQVVLQIVVDLSVISVVFAATGGIASGLAILYLFPLAGGAILMPMLLSLFFAALVTLTLLVLSGMWLLYSPSDASISQAGLYGAAFFFVVYSINRMAQKLILQEQLAVEQAEDLRIHQAINRLVIAGMDDGVLVVDRDGTILTVNPAAERMLGILVPESHERSKLDAFPLLKPIADAFFSWVTQQPRMAAEPVYVVLKASADSTVLDSAWARRDPSLHLRLQFATVETAAPHHDRTVIFLQDVGEIENQAQQLKLASMGRLTASIAHEVRNPLSAIAHAAALLGEDNSDPTHARMARIVDVNVARINRMVEDILKLSRKVHTPEAPVALEQACRQILDEFQEAYSVRKGLLQMGAMGRHSVIFDPLHLREVLVNLLGNAMRYASGEDGSIRVFLIEGAAGRLELHVQDDGPAITPQIRSHLFEPFYTTSSKGTGLGLYLARELCLNNNAMLDYEYRQAARKDDLNRSGGRFVITFSLNRYD